MNKTLSLCLAALLTLLALVASSANAAVYVVQKVDGRAEDLKSATDNINFVLAQVSTDARVFTEVQVAAMNRLHLDTQLKAGNKLLYFNDQDVADAISWCRKRISELSIEKYQWGDFQADWAALTHGYVRFLPHDPWEDIPFWKVFVYADLWRTYQAKHK